MSNSVRSENEWAQVYGAHVRSSLVDAPLDLLIPWTDATGNPQPFRPYAEDKLQELADNIQKNGIIEPICVRPMPDGNYQIIAGHNRVAAARMVGLTTVPALLQEMTDDEAAVRMIDSNLQHREDLLPSEKAFAYKTRLDAMNRQGQRTNSTSTPVGSKSRSNDALASEVGEGREQIRRYIRLTYLESRLLDMVDNKKLALRAAVELSYLPKEGQCNLLDVMDSLGVKAPSMKQATALRSASGEGELDSDRIFEILSDTEKKKEVKLPTNRIRSFFPSGTSIEEMEAIILEALAAFQKERGSGV